MSERIDSHHHLWAINDTDYVWMTDDHAVIRRDFLGAEMKSAFAEGSIANAEYFLNDLPGQIFIEDLPSGQSGVIAHNPVLQFEDLLIALGKFDKHFVKHFRPVFIGDGDILKFLVDGVEDDGNLVVEVVSLEVVVDVGREDGQQLFNHEGLGLVQQFVPG